MTATATFDYFETLGEGTAGIVYRAKDPKGREVAVKLLRESAAKNPELLRRFRREVDIATMLEHENLVRAFEGGLTAAGRLFLSSEFVRGANAGRLLEANRPLAEPAALALARDMARALGYLKTQNLVHRDVKPENVLVRQDGVGKLSDMGLARSAAPDGARLTATGEVLGTPYYLAPEQIQARKDVDVRADLYSLGCMLHEWLAGKRPFEGGSVVEILAGHIKHAAPDLAAARPGLDPRTVALVADLMQKDREKRPADAAAIERRLDEILAGIGAGDGRAALRDAVARVPAAAPARPGAGLAPAATLTSADAVEAQGKTVRLKLKLAGSRTTLTLFAIAGDKLQLGRDAVDKSQNDVCLRVRGPGGDAGSKRISGSHLRIELGEKGAGVKDLETTGGTRVAGVKLQPRVASWVRSSGVVDVAGGALVLELRVVPGAGAGALPAAVIVTRPQNGSEHAYVLLREKVVIDGGSGEPRVGAANGSILAVKDGAFTWNGQPLAAGQTVKASGLVVEAAEIRPEDMK
jgi:hypothetical protein